MVTWREWPVPSFSRAGHYLVRHSHYRALRPGQPGTDRWSCDCPAFPKHQAAGKVCKHVKVAQAAAKALERCVGLGHHVRFGRHDQDVPGKWVCMLCLAALLAGAARKVARDYRPKQRRKGRG